ncbi:succinylglutamate desuccinylase/aspartoacylase family protein [Bacteroidota bacterium]
MKYFIEYSVVQDLRTTVRLKILLLIACVYASSSLLAQENENFVINDITALPGQIVTGKLNIEEGVDEGTFIPITIINGQNPGPVLTLSAGIHGTEYVPIVALQALASKIDPKNLSGTVIIVHVANIPAFLSRSVYTGPIDQKNLNRVFPGKEDGTISERIAFTLTNEILSRSDYYIDLHGGEFNEELLNYLYFFYGCPDNDLCEKSRMMAHAMGNNYFIPFKYNTVHDTLSSMYAFYEAYRQGAAVIVVEFGDQGKVDSEVLQSAKKGVINVMRTIGMLEGETFVNEHPVYLIERKFIQSEYDGTFYTLVDKGQSISKGTLLGYMSDYWGNILEEYRSPYSGIVVSTRPSPAIKKGDPLLHLGKVSDTFELE